MKTTDLMADTLVRNLGMLKSTLADFSDEEMLVRPTPSANHAAWQLGHLVAAESRLLEAVAPGAAAPLPEGFAQRYTKETTRSDDPAAFHKKAELLDAFDKARAASVAWVKGLSEADMEKEGPQRMRDFIPTAGHLALMLPSHTMMHVGQFQVIRRKLGKPILF